MRDLESKINEMSQDIAVIKASILGNGTKGLSERLTDVEGSHTKLQSTVDSYIITSQVRKGDIFCFAGGTLGFLAFAIDCILQYMQRR